jgi:hypothetical protein
MNVVRSEPLDTDHVSELTLTVSGELEDVFDGSERVVAVVIQRPCVPVLVVGSLHADTMLDCTESSSPGESSTRWSRPCWRECRW